MDAFDIEMAAPVDQSRFREGLRGPNQGSHVGPNWYIQYGMDLGAEKERRSMPPSTPTSPGSSNTTRQPTLARFMVRTSSCGQRMTAWAPSTRTSRTHRPSSASDPRLLGATCSGAVASAGGIPPHLHVALVEIVGGLPDGQYHGEDLYWFFLDLEATDPGTVVPVTFLQDGSPPVPQTP